MIWAAAFIYDVAAVKKIHGVPPPRFNLVFKVSALFHHEWSRFHHEWPRFNIVSKCFKPTSFLKSPHLVLISFCRRNKHFHKPCLTPHLVFIIVNKCSCSYIISYLDLDGSFTIRYVILLLLFGCTPLELNLRWRFLVRVLRYCNCTFNQHDY